MLNRESSIELLRIFSEVGVILLHYNLGKVGGAFVLSQNEICRKALYFEESLFICAVDLFVIISGHFLSFNKKIKIKKVVSLYIETIFINTIFT